MDESQTVIAFKGTDANMRCRGFQYEIGKEYETDEAVCCKSGFHACEYPLDVYRYYDPAHSRFFKVEQTGTIERSNDDSKVSSTKIKFTVELTIADMVKAATEWVKERTAPENSEHATGDGGAASVTGDRGAASVTGYGGAASVTGDRGAASVTGDGGAASVTGDRGAAAAENSSVALAAGYKCKAKGDIGSAICVVERGEWDGKSYPLKAIRAAIVDGVNIKANTWYKLQNGEFIVAGDE